MLHLFSSVMRIAENGRLPDSVCRLGIRNLLRRRLTALEEGSPEQHSERFRQFLTDCRNSPIAVLPERANEQHYEVPAEFFQTVLGPHLKYSCGDWTTAESLEQAEDAALEVTCRRAQIQDGMDILELGCGWGSLTLQMAERCPSGRILAVSNSESQRQFIQQRAAERGLSNVDVVTADMNDFSTDRSFDRVVSVEMFEHMRNHEKLLGRIRGWLVPAGKLFVHIFCHSRHAYLFETHDEKDWMARHFFSGGMMPSEQLLMRYQKDLRLTDHWRWSGLHYARTSEAWLKRLDQNTPRMSELFADIHGPDQAVVWINRWRLFFMACAELFGFRNGNEWWVSHYLFERPD